MSEAFWCACFKAQVRQVDPEALADSGSSQWQGQVLLTCAQLGNSQTCLPVLLWISYSCFLFQWLCTMNKGSEICLFSTSHEGFSELFLFCFECERKVPDPLMYLGVRFFLYSSAHWGNVCISCLFMLPCENCPMRMKSRWSQPPSVLPCDRGVVSACRLSETSFIYIVRGLLISPHLI